MTVIDEDTDGVLCGCCFTWHPSSAPCPEGVHCWCKEQED